MKKVLTSVLLAILATAAFLTMVTFSQAPLYLNMTEGQVQAQREKAMNAHEQACEAAGGIWGLAEQGTCDRAYLPPDLSWWKEPVLNSAYDFEVFIVVASLVVAIACGWFLNHLTIKEM